MTSRSNSWLMWHFALSTVIAFALLGVASVPQAFAMEKMSNAELVGQSGGATFFTGSCMNEDPTCPLKGCRWDLKPGEVIPSAGADVLIDVKYSDHNECMLSQGQVGTRVGRGGNATCRRGPGKIYQIRTDKHGGTGQGVPNCNGGLISSTYSCPINSCANGSFLVP